MTSYLEKIEFGWVFWDEGKLGEFFSILLAKVQSREYYN
jgi:hypothetical protein